MDRSVKSEIILALKKELYFGFFLITLCFFASAQKKPDWTDAEKRLIKYSESRYLTGFYSERNALPPSGKKLDILKGYARSELVQSILASIVSLGELKISTSNENGDIRTEEDYEQSSLILAEADIVGLQYETYYDEKNKEVYAFVYADISKVINYYRNIIDVNEGKIKQKISDANQFENNPDNESALREYLQCYPLFSEVREAQGLLVALGKVDAISLKKDRINSLESRMKRGVSRLMDNENLTMEELAYFFSFGLKTQVNDCEDPILFHIISFEDTGLESDFSKKFHKIYESKLVDVTDFDIRNVKNIENKEVQNFNAQLSTSYWQQNDEIKIVSTLRKNRKTIGSMQGNLSIRYFSAENIDFDPGHTEKIAQLNLINLEAVNKKLRGTYSSPLEYPLKVKVIPIDESDSTSIMADIPIKFTYADDIDEPFGPVYTTKKSIAEGHIEIIRKSKRLQIITASIDLENFLGISPVTSYYQKILNSFNVPSTTFYLSVSGIPVYINERKDDFYIIPKIKQVLSESGFEFVSDYENALMFIEVDEKIREGGSFYNQSVSYVDAKVDITDLKTGASVYSNAFNSVKGVDINHEKASIKALNNICEKLKKDIYSYLRNR